MYGGVGEVQKGDVDCVGEDLGDGTTGGERVCCAREEGGECCSPLVSGVVLAGELWGGLLWMESDLENEKDGRLEERPQDDDVGTVFGRGGDSTTSS